MGDQKPKSDSDNDSDIIIVENAPEIITATKSLNKPKTKKHCKRKVKLGKVNNNMETLLITQRLNVKRTKFIHVINIENLCKEKRYPDSIIRFARNECKKEAYYNRIVPGCRRKRCFPTDMSLNCCRTAKKEEYRSKKTELKDPRKKSGTLSPISTISLTDSITISYEEVSDNSFSSEEELDMDTLIKRTKEREKQLVYPLNPAPLASTPIPSEDTASIYSGASLHTISTRVLQPLENEAYSPTTSPEDLCNVNVPYSPTMTPDWIYEDIEDCKLTESPFSPTNPTETPNFSETEIYDNYKAEKDGRAGYSEANPPWDEVENNDKHKRDIPIVYEVQNGVVKAEINENNNHFIKTEDIKREEESESEIYEYNKNGQYLLLTEVNKNNNRLINTEKIKCENDNASDVNDNFKVFAEAEKLLSFGSEMFLHS